MEIGTSKGQFQVIRLYPTDEAPDGGFVLRVSDDESGITFVASMSTENGLRLASGFNTDGDADYLESIGRKRPTPVVVMPSSAEARIHGGGEDRRVPIDEPGHEAPAEAPAPAEEPATG